MKEDCNEKKEATVVNDTDVVEERLPVFDEADDDEWLHPEKDHENEKVPHERA